MSGFPPRLLVLVGDDPEAREVPEAAGRPDVREALEVAGQVRGGLERAGLGVPVLRTVRSLAEVRQALAEVRPVLVVNLVESLRGREAFEPAVAWVLESAGVPFTGSTAATLRACLDKGWTATVLARDGVPIPRTSVWRRDARTFPLPAIVKPLRTDASVGITASSVVRDADALASRARQIQEAFGGEVLVQEFLPGRELNVAFLGNDVLPPSEIDFTGFPEGLPRIVTYEAKWNPESPEYAGTVSVGAVLDPALDAAVRQVARRAWRAMDLRDYGRVDLRLDAAGRPRVIEVNPNCDLALDAGFMRTCARAGMGPDEVVARISRAALARGPDRREGTWRW